MPTNRLIVKEEVAVYAAVLFDGALEAGGQEAVLEVRDQMVRVAEAMRTNMELSVALSDPGYTPEQRGELARNVFAGCNPVLLDVLAVLADRGDAALLPRVLENYAEQLQSKLNLCVVDVRRRFRWTTPCDASLRKKPKPIWTRTSSCARASTSPYWAASS